MNMYAQANIDLQRLQLKRSEFQNVQQIHPNHFLEVIALHLPQNREKARFDCWIVAIKQYKQYIMHLIGKKSDYEFLLSWKTTFDSFKSL